MPTKKSFSFKLIDDAIVNAQTAVEAIPCERAKKPDTNCLREAHTLPIGKNGKTQFWYALDCDLPRKKFCSPCLAYWLIAVARNEVLWTKQARAQEEATKASSDIL